MIVTPDTAAASLRPVLGLDEGRKWLLRLWRSVARTRPGSVRARASSSTPSEAQRSDPFASDLPRTVVGRGW
jgi:hypothetical protein